MSPKPTSPLLGYNNNVRHKGKVFHVQTEDSGVKYGHIITQLFMDGGRILKSVKTSYSEYIASERRGEIVREMMKQQHKAMFIALRDGRFDAAIEAAGSGAMVAPISLPSHPTQPESTTVPTHRPAVETAIQEAVAAGADAAARYVASELPLPPSLARAPRPLTPAAPTVKMLSQAQPSLPVQPTLPAQPSPPVQPGASAATSPSPTAVPPTLTRPARPISAPRRDATPVAPVTSRYAITRPASIFGQSPPLRGRSVFGDDLISDKSLDEVILSYLAAELENEKK
jgi:hypothetical protein